MANRTAGTTLDAASLRRLAVEFEVDPRTILKLARGEDVRGMARRRAARALRKVGVELPNDDSTEFGDHAFASPGERKKDEARAR